MCQISAVLTLQLAVAFCMPWAVSCLTAAGTELASLLASLLSLSAKCSILSSAALRTSVYIAGLGHSRLQSKRGGLAINSTTLQVISRGLGYSTRLDFTCLTFGFLLLEENHSSKNLS